MKITTNDPIQRRLLAVMAAVGIMGAALYAATGDSGTPSALDAYATARAEQAESTSEVYVGPQNIREALPNVRYQIFDNRPANTHVVRGRVTLIERDKSMSRTPTGEFGDDVVQGDVAYGDFEATDADYRILLVTVRVDQVIGGPGGDTVRFEWLVPGPGAGSTGSENVDDAEAALRELGDALWFLTDYGTTSSEDGRMYLDPIRGVVDVTAGGELAMPFMPSDEVPAWFDGVRTIADIRDQAQSRGRSVEGVPGDSGA